MDSIILFTIIIAIYLLISYVFFKIICASKSKTTIVLCLLYMLLTYGYNELIFRINYKLQDNGVYIGVGHASILLVEAFLTCILICLIVIILTISKRKRQSQK